MRQQELLRILGERYKLRVLSQFHVQIETPKGPHNIYFDSRGGVKYQPCGQREAHETYAEKLLRMLPKYDFAETDLAEMEQLHKFLRRLEGKKSGIWVDAGYKANRAKLCIIRISSGGNMDIAVRVLQWCDSSFVAEMAAITIAQELHPGDEPIYSDCAAAVAANQPRAAWISRKQNKDADKLGNMRGGMYRT